MKYCQKCVDAIVGFMDSSGLFPVRPQREMLSRPFPESECEFWAHKALNYLDGEDGIVGIIGMYENLKAHNPRAVKSLQEDVVKAFQWAREWGLKKDLVTIG